MCRLPVRGVVRLLPALVVLALRASPCLGLGPCLNTEVISVSTTGERAGGSGSPSISADGRFVAFASAASNIVAGDTNGLTDIFVRDRLTRTTERVSLSSGGQQGNAGSGSPAISADGRFVAFGSVASNLVANDTNNQSDVFVRDRVAGATELVSVSSAGQQTNGISYAEDISGDGRFVAFMSAATNLVPDDTNGKWDVFVHDRLARTTERVSVSSQSAEGDQTSLNGSISADGRFVAFQSMAMNLVPDDTNGHEDIFVRDRETANTTRVSVAPDGSQFEWGSEDPAISGDGAIVVFMNDEVLFVRDQAAGTTISLGHWFAWDWDSPPAISPDGRYVAKNVLLIGGHGREEMGIAVIDIQMESGGGGIAGWARDPSLSDGGRYLAFESFGSGVSYVLVCDGEGDLTPPETEIVDGPCGQVVSSPTASISWRGSDPPVDGVAGPVAFAWRLDGWQWSPWTTNTSLTLTGIGDGLHAFEVKARDLNGNEDPTPARCEFTVTAGGAKPSITSPTNGATVRGIVTITATATATSGIQKVEFYAAGGLISTDTSPPYSYSWDTRPTPVAEGATPLCAEAYANDGSVAQGCVLVTVDNTTFDDVPKTSPQWAYVEALVRAGITTGCSASPPMYCPYNSITRAQMAVFLCRAAGKGPLDRATPTFCDVPKTNPYYGWIERLADRDSWDGTPPTIGCTWFPCRKFCPSTAVLRDEMAAFLVRATGKTPMPSCSRVFADVSPSSWACPYIERLIESGIWPGGEPITSGCACPSGYPQGSKCYCPKSNVTRGQMAVFLVRAFGIPL